MCFRILRDKALRSKNLRRTDSYGEDFCDVNNAVSEDCGHILLDANQYWNNHWCFVGALQQKGAECFREGIFYVV